MADPGQQAYYGDVPLEATGLNAPANISGRYIIYSHYCLLLSLLLQSSDQFIIRGLIIVVMIIIIINYRCSSD